MTSFRTSVVALIALSPFACMPPASSVDDSLLLAEVIEMTAPAPPGSQFPRLSSAGNRLRLNWLQPDAEEGFWIVATAASDGNGWESTRTVTRSDELFVNWADFPSVVEAPDGVLTAHWLQKSGPGTYAYDVRMSLSRDGGDTWAPSFTPHRDGVAAEHGFVTLVPAGDGSVNAVWLDGREMVDDGPMTLRSTTIAPDGTLGEDALLDPRVCECCQTGAALVGNDMVAVYRDRSDDEVRDIWSVARREGVWQAPVRVAADNWQIPGCPVNGPALASNGGSLAVAWFGLVGGAPEVKLAFSHDVGASWSVPILVERGTDGAVTSGRVDLRWIDDSRVAVSWLTGVEQTGEIRVQAADAGGLIGSPVVVGTTSSSRSAGFPRMIRHRDRLIFAWTVPGDPPTIRMAALPLGAAD